MIINADCTGSGPVDIELENIIQTHVFPYYANVHSDAFCSDVMSTMIQTSRDIIKQSCVENTDEYALIFTGQGMTGAARHLAFLLKSVVSVIYTTLEHVSNSTLWESVFKTSSVRVVHSLHDDVSVIDTDHLSRQLHDAIQTSTKKKRGILFVAYTACSNVLGRVQPVKQIMSVIDSYRKKATDKGLRIVTCVDCAAIAPYFPLKQLCHGNDAIVLSPHKFKGGQSTPGVLIVKKCVAELKKIPFYPGGGTVWYKHKKECNHFLVNNIEHREEGGTPNIIGIIRTGLVFKRKELHQNEITERIRSILSTVDRFFHEHLIPFVELYTVIDNNNSPRLPIYSFRIKDVHPGLFVKVLSDEYGIQTRSGVSCCYLLAEELCHVKTVDRNSILKGKGTPNTYGWIRVSFHYDFSDSMVIHILKCIKELVHNIHSYESIYSYECSLNKWYRKHRDVNKKEIPRIVQNLFNEII